jgi:Raf kinase inhibitor-like YbhB/YbcL family protein
MNRLALTVVLSTACCGSALAGPLKVESSDIKPGATLTNRQVAGGFGCSGSNVSPSVSWSGAPEGAKSFAVTMYDPDAPTGSGFWHWVAFNIPAGTTSLPQNAGDPKANLMPAGTIQVKNDAGSPGYFGACPPQGDPPHRYIVTVFAVDVDKLDADANASPAVIGFNLHFHTLEKGALTGLYGR